MNQIKKIVTMVLGVIAIVIATSGNVNATEVVPFSTVVVKANVPEDFTEIIGFTLKAEDEERGTTVTLTKEKGYVVEMDCIMGGKVYETQYAFNNMEDYRVDIAEKYEINGLNVELTFNVTKIEYSIENPDAPATVTALTPIASTAMPVEDVDDSEYDELTGLKKAMVVLEDFKQATSFMETDANFQNYLKMYEGEMFKDAYLDADPMNTVEQWEAMSTYEKFTYHLCYTAPYSYLAHRDDARDVEEFIENFCSQKTLLEVIERGDEVYAALEEVLTWHYKYWLITGTVGNMFSYYDGVNAGTPTQEEAIKLTDEDKEDFAVIQSELSEELGTDLETPEFLEEPEEENAILAKLKENIFTLIVLALAGVAVVVVTIYNRKKNIDDMTND